MLLSSHFIVGSAVGKISGNWWLAGIFGLISHFLIDAIPHWDLGYKFKKNTASFIKIGLDLLIGLIVVTYMVYFWSSGGQDLIDIIVGGVFGVLPDAILGFIMLFRIKPLRWYVGFHNKFHWFIKEKRPEDVFEFKELPETAYSIFWGLFWQILVVAIFIMLSILL